MRYSFSDDPSLSGRLFDLLETAFPSIRQGAESIRALGVTWESVSTPFIHFENGRAVSHVGVIELSLILLDELVKVGSIHAVATHPEFRHRGHYRKVMSEALDYCADRYETLVLTTEHPEYFEPFGFRNVKEHMFRMTCDCPGGVDGLRLLVMQDAGDIALLHRLLETRKPVSNVVGVVNEKAIFCFNEGHRPLHYAQALDVIICMEVEGKHLKVFDIVGPKIPSLAELLACIPHRFEEITICFGADLLANDAEAVPYFFDHGGPSYLMVHGPFVAEGHKFTLPRSART
jgi:predicted N-acetyltransferase YhbS